MSQGNFASAYKNKVKEKELQRLKDLIAGGTPFHELSQEERDFVHMETSEENVLYWKNENELAEADDRCMHCQAIARNIIAALRALDPPVDDSLDNLLSTVLEEADALPQTH